MYLILYCWRFSVKYLFLGYRFRYLMLRLFLRGCWFMKRYRYLILFLFMRRLIF